MDVVWDEWLIHKQNVPIGNQYMFGKVTKFSITVTIIAVSISDGTLDTFLYFKNMNSFFYLIRTSFLFLYVVVLLALYWFLKLTPNLNFIATYAVKQ